jgi:serine/threonine protein kinase/tetratricopeptide (TPR) repeat protein
MGDTRYLMFAGLARLASRVHGLPAVMKPRTPQRLGRYTLVRKIGEGGMAEVFLADVTVAEGLVKRVVVKKIRREFADQPEFSRMFVDEAKIALGLNHANIVQVFDFGQIQGELYLAMELVEGVDLMRLIHAVHERGERVPTVIAAYVAHQIASGLSYAHVKQDEFGAPIGIVHRDISPHNVMVSYAGTVKVLDFGIARPSGSGRGPEGIQVALRGPARDGEMTIQGKIAYMSPEQAMGRRVDPRADLYALGVVLFEMLSGRLVFRGLSQTAALEAVRGESLPPLLTVAPMTPPALAAIVDRALMRDPEDRWESARALQSALAGFLHRADPVVDDDVLSHFVRSALPPPPLLWGREGPGDESITRELESPPGGRSSAVESRRVIALRAVLAPVSEATTDPSRFLRIARDVAYKRDALLTRADDRGLLCFFGVEGMSGGAEEAARVAHSLREMIGDAAPGFGIGVALAEVVVAVERVLGAAPRAVIDPVIEAGLAAVAAAAIDGAVMVVGGLAERLREGWEVGPIAAIVGQEGGAEVVSAAPLVGRLHGAERRIHHAPGARSILYGRELELKALRDAFAEAIRGRRASAALVIGEAGIGKRALIDRFVAGIPGEAAAVLRVQGQWRRRNVPLWAVAELLAALPCAAAPPSGYDGMGRRFADAVASLASARPVLVVVEALHFVDAQSLTLLQEWLLSAPPLPALLVLSARPGRRIEALQRGLTTTIALGELDAQARREMIVRRFEDPAAADGLASAILARTAGNPLFIEETLAMLLRQGVIGWDAEARFLVVRARDAVIEAPPSVEAVLLARLDAMDPDDRALVEAAAVLGQRFRAGELAQLVLRDQAEVLDRLASLGIFEADQGSPHQIYRFLNVSLHEACKEALSGGQRELLHGRAVALKRGRADYRAGIDDGPIAEHLILAGRTGESIGPALAAADAAAQLAGNVEAHYFLTLALRALAPEDPRRFAVLGRREPILRAWGQRRAQGADLREMITLASASGDPSMEMEAQLRLLRFYVECGRSHHAELLVPRLAARLPMLGDPASAAAELGELRSELMRRRGAFLEAESTALAALAACGGDAAGRRQRCRLYQLAGQAQLGGGRLQGAAESFEEALRIARELGDRRLEAAQLNALGEVAGRSTRYQQAIDCFSEALEIDRALGDRMATGQKLANLGITYTAIGLYRRAERFLRKALELHEALGDTALLNDVVVHLGEVMFELGDRAGARSLLSDAAAMAASRGDLRIEVRAQIRLAGADVDEAAGDPGRLDAAAALAAQVLARVRAAGGLRTAICRAHHVLSRIEEARGAWAAAIEHERAAVALVLEGAAPVDGVLSLLHLGRLLVGYGDPEEGARWLAEAAAKTQARLDDLRDPALRCGYLEQPKVRELLGL